MIDSTILAALIGLAGSAVGSCVGVLASASLTQYRLAQLEKKVDSHNQHGDKIYKLEDRVNILDERVKVANHRIEDLERKTETL